MIEQTGCQPFDQHRESEGMAGQRPSDLTHEITTAERLSENSYLEFIYNCKNGLRKHYQKQLKPMRIEKTKQSCQVCQCEYERNDIVLRTPCQHLLHKQCSKPWFKVSGYCPICRLDLNKYFQELPPIDV